MIINSCVLFSCVLFFIFQFFCPHQLSPLMGDFFCLTVCPRGKWYSLKVSHFPTSLNNLNCGFAYSETGLLPGNNCSLEYEVW